MMTYLLYDVETGRILLTGVTSSPANILALVTPTTDAITGVSASDIRHRVVDGAVVERPALDLPAARLVADGSEQEIAAGLPVGTRVLRDGALPGEVDDDAPLTMAPVEPGTFVLTLQPPFPWRETTITVTIDEAPVAFA